MRGGREGEIEIVPVKMEKKDSGRRLDIVHK